MNIANATTIPELIFLKISIVRICHGGSTETHLYFNTQHKWAFGILFSSCHLQSDEVFY